MDHPAKSTSGLIPVFTGTIKGQSAQLCNARDLHVFLQVGKDFNTWIKDRIQTYGFIEGDDFCTAENLSSPILGSSKSRPQRMVDYHLTLDTAKEIAMVEKNDQGRQARRYFIECERKAHEAAAGVKQPLLGNQISKEVEKACDMTSWLLANEVQRDMMMHIGNSAREGDDNEIIWPAAFLIKRRLYQRLEALAKDLFGKNIPDEEVVDILLCWRPEA